ncbi:MAG: nucleotidyltransferase family protein [Pseudomonadota bacterium]
MSGSLDAAVVLAAGLGLRMRPLSETRPKPLVEVAGRTLLDRVVDRLVEAGVRRCVVNASWLGEQIAAWAPRRTDIALHVSMEDEPLETGGGVARALREKPDWFPTDRPVAVANGDALWLNGYEDALMRLQRQWRPDVMDALLLVHPTVSAYGYDGQGDFEMDADGRLTRRAAPMIAPFMFTGVQLLAPSVFADPPATAKYSLNVIYGAAAAADRLFGVRHDGAFFHVGTPADLKVAESGLADPNLGRPYF